jgi:hypothetical protein
MMYYLVDAVQMISAELDQRIKSMQQLKAELRAVLKSLGGDS